MLLVSEEHLDLMHLDLRQSVAISGKQWQSVALSGNQWHLDLMHLALDEGEHALLVRHLMREVIHTHEWSSEAISGSQHAL